MKKTSPDKVQQIPARQVVENQVTDAPVTCASCEACCCRLEVLLITDTGVPERFIDTDQWGGQTMLRLDDGFCAALDRNTHLCTIYEKRPLICREFTAGEPDCIDQRTAWL